MGVKPQREGVFHPNHRRYDDLTQPLDVVAPGDRPIDRYFNAAPGVTTYMEICDKHYANGHGFDENCPHCRTETIAGRR